MKKFYTLLSVALFAAGSLSAASLKTAVTLSNVSASTEKLEYSIAGKGSIKLKSVAPRIKDPNEKGAPNLAGDWIFECISEDAAENEFYGVTTFVEGEKENEYIIKNFLDGYFVTQPKDIKATVAKEMIGTTSVYILSFEKTPVAATINGLDYSLYLYAYSTEEKQYYFYTGSEIAYAIIEQEDGSLILTSAYTTQDAQNNLYPAGVFFGVQKADGWYGGTALMPTIYPTSATMEASVFNFETQDFVDASYRIFAGINPNTLQMSFLNFAGSHNMIVGQSSQDMASVTITNQVYGSGSIKQDGTGDPKPYILTSNVESTSNILTGTMSANSDQLVLTFPGETSAYNKEGNIYMGIWKDITIKYDTDDAQGGVDNVIADSDANAPVEYYNLQGVRVVNPEAGQLVIKRQGKTVSKIVVR